MKISRKAAVTAVFGTAALAMSAPALAVTLVTASSSPASAPDNTPAFSAVESNAASTGSASAASDRLSATERGTIAASAEESSIRVSDALAAIEGIRIRSGDESPASEYSGRREELFGPAWTDEAVGVALAGNECDTRNDILLRDLEGTTRDDDGCTIITGTLQDPYTGATIPFIRGQGTSSAVQIDHVVALGDAWVSGAGLIDQDKRVALANDPDNLLAVDGPTNSAKGAQAADSWLPPNFFSHCDYVSRQTIVKDRYALSMTQAEKDKIVEILGNCSSGDSDSPDPTSSQTPSPSTDTDSSRDQGSSNERGGDTNTRTNVSTTGGNERSGDRRDRDESRDPGEIRSLFEGDDFFIPIDQFLNNGTGGPNAGAGNSGGGAVSQSHSKSSTDTSHGHGKANAQGGRAETKSKSDSGPGNSRSSSSAIATG